MGDQIPRTRSRSMALRDVSWCFLVGLLSVLAGKECASDTDGLSIQLAYIGSFNVQTVTPNIHAFIQAAFELSAYTPADARPQLFFPEVAGPYNSSTTRFGNRLALCAAESDTVHYNTSAIGFVRCVSSTYEDLLRVGYSSTADGSCTAKNNVTTCVEKIGCYEQLATTDAAEIYESDLVSKCAAENNLNYDELHKCAESEDGAGRQKTNTAACKEYLFDQYDAAAGKSGGTVGGLKTASSFLGRRSDGESAPSGDPSGNPSGRRLLFNMNSLDFFGHKHHGPSAGDVQADQWMLSQPLFMASDDGKHVNPFCKFNSSMYESYTCTALQLIADEHDLKQEDVWAWVAGMAVGFSIVMSAVGVAILHWREKYWHKPDAFTRPELDPKTNPFKFIRLDDAGALDQDYEATVDPLPLKWLVGVAGSHSKDSYKKEAVCEM